MLKKVTIFLFTLPILIFVITTTILFYSEKTQVFLINSFNLKSVLNKKVKNFVSKKINDENITIKISSIKLLKPSWPDIIKIELNDVKLYTINQKAKSKIKFIELGFSYQNLLRNIFYNRDNIVFSYLNFKDLNLNAKLEKNKFTPGPLIKIFSLINQREYYKDQSLKKILQNKIIIGNINLHLSDQRNVFKERILKINCTNVYISKFLNKTRSLNMKCNQNQKLQFSVVVDLFESFNNFSGNIQNVDSKLIFSNWFQENFKLNTKDFSGLLNGNFNIITDKNFNIESFNFLSNKSNLIIRKSDKKIPDTKFSGEIFWSKKDNLLKFNDLLIGDIIVKYSEIDLKTKTGFSKLQVKKISTVALKDYLNPFVNSNVLKKYNNSIRGGFFKNIELNLNFSFLNKIYIKKVTGYSNFSNIRFEHNDKIFKKIFCTITGKFKLEINSDNNEILDEKSWAKINIDASKGMALLRSNNLEHKFDYAKIKVKIYKNHYNISEAKFFSHNSEYSFKDVEINQNTYIISKASFIKNNELQYLFEDTRIDKQIITNSILKVKNNRDFSDYLKKNFNIEIIGDIDFNFNLSGNIKNLDLKLKLSSNLTNSAFKLSYLNLKKKKNISSSIKSQIIFQKGKLVFLKDIILKIGENNFETGLIRLNGRAFKKILLENIKTPEFDLKKILINKDHKIIKVNIFGKKIDFSSFKRSLQNQANYDKDIIFDITADKIILDPKIYFAGNFKGNINKSFFKATAFGQMWLSEASLLDTGKFQIFIDDKISKLDGFGLVGGAETKIVMKKNKNKFPEISFDTSDGGKLLKALGLTKNIRSGEMKMNIKFLNDEYDHYKGIIKSKNFSLINTPGIINSLSILSFSGIQSVISGEGVNFDKGQASINFKNNMFNFDKVYLSSQSLGIAAKGKINLHNKTLDMRGSVAPIKLISQIISVVPAVGELITGLKKEGLFAGQFKMFGPIKYPKVELNTLSFAPGILRDLFADDWLNNKNFFLDID